MMNTNAAVAKSFWDILVDLGSIPAERVRLDPPPGTATINDLLKINDRRVLCELIDATLVEKPMGWSESIIALVLGRLIGDFVDRNNLGFSSGPDGLIRILHSQVRGPDFAYVSWDRLPDGKMPEAAYPEIVPDLVIEVLSPSNTYAEMSRKRREYFHAGVRQVWMVDPSERTVAVYTDITLYELFDEDSTLSGADILPGLEISLAKVFGELDRRRPEET